MLSWVLEMETVLSEYTRNQSVFSDKLARPNLVKDHCFVNGQWLGDARRERLIVRDPANDSIIGSVQPAGVPLVQEAIARAQSSLAEWRAMLAKHRGILLERWASLMRKHREDLALIIVHEQGKPIREARSEIDYAQGFLSWFSAEGERVQGSVLAPHKPNRKMIVQKEPVGVVAAITPWNFPCAMITRKAGAALAAGCPIIVHPSPDTPFSALALAVLAQEAGIPSGVFNVLVGDSPEIVSELNQSQVIRALTFTGSTRVGKLIMRESANTVKKVAMELGGHAPFIVFADADIDRAVADAIEAKFTTTGQDCLAANRIFVERTVYEEFCTRFAGAAEALKLGPGIEEDVDQGPLIDRRAVDKCLAHVQDAMNSGARLMVGGEPLNGDGNFFPPTVLSDVTAEMLISKDETFGPIAAISPFDAEDEAVIMANSTPYGLAAYLYTSDHSRIWRVSDALEYGMIGVNTASFTGPPIPFGGVKQSGLGREGGDLGIEDFLETKYLCIGLG